MESGDSYFHLQFSSNLKMYISPAVIRAGGQGRYGAGVPAVLTTGRVHFEYHNFCLRLIKWVHSKDHSLLFHLGGGGN